MTSAFPRSRALLAATAWALLGSAAVLADTPPPAATPAQAPGERLATLDKDNDGRISRAEAETAPRLAGRFDKIDADKDGFLSRDEMRAAHEHAREEMRQRAEQRFAEADRNGDGQIDLGEAQAGMPRAAENFQKLDRDHNGTLSREELRDGAITQMHERRKEHGSTPTPPPHP